MVEPIPTHAVYARLTRHRQYRLLGVAFSEQDAQVLGDSFRDAETNMEVTAETLTIDITARMVAIPLKLDRAGRVPLGWKNASID